MGHSFTVPVGVDDAWRTLLDIEQVAPCMPGATLESVDGDAFTGSVKVRLGPIGLTYQGRASFVEKDEAAHRAVIDAQGKDARGNGTAKAIVTATLHDEGGGSTKVDVLTDLNITGKPAQFGRGVMLDVGTKLIGQFADCLAGKLGASGTPPEPAPAPVATDSERETAPAAVDSERETAPAAVDSGRERAPAADIPAEIDEALISAGVEPSAENGATPGEVVTNLPTDRPAFEPSIGAASGGTAASPSPASRPRPARSTPPPEVEPIDLMASAGPAVLRRMAPLAALLALIVAVVVLRRRSR